MLELRASCAGLLLGALAVGCGGEAGSTALDGSVSDSSVAPVPDGAVIDAGSPPEAGPGGFGTLQTIDGLGPTASNTVVLAVPVSIMDALEALKDLVANSETVLRGLKQQAWLPAGNGSTPSANRWAYDAARVSSE